MLPDTEVFATIEPPESYLSESGTLTVTQFRKLGFVYWSRLGKVERLGSFLKDWFRSQRFPTSAEKIFSPEFDCEFPVDIYLSVPHEQLLDYMSQEDVLKLLSKMEQEAVEEPSAANTFVCEDLDKHVAHVREQERIHYKQVTSDPELWFELICDFLQVAPDRRPMMRFLGSSRVQLAVQMKFTEMHNNAPDCELLKKVARMGSFSLSDYLALERIRGRWMRGSLISSFWHTSGFARLRWN